MPHKYSLEIHVESKTWDDLTNGHYKLYLRKVTDVSAGPSLDDIKGATLHELGTASPIKVDWTASASSTNVHYDFSYIDKEGKTFGQRVPLEIGEVAQLNKDGTLGVMKDNPQTNSRPPWAAGALGFKNAIRAVPLVYERGHNDPIGSATGPAWVPGEGTLKPKPPKDEISAWFYSDFGRPNAPNANHDFDTTDFSTAATMQFQFVSGDVAADQIMYDDTLDSPWGIHTGTSSFPNSANPAAVTVGANPA